MKPIIAVRLPVTFCREILTRLTTPVLAKKSTLLMR